MDLIDTYYEIEAYIEEKIDEFYSEAPAMHDFYNLTIQEDVTKNISDIPKSIKAIKKCKKIVEDFIKDFHAMIKQVAKESEGEEYDWDLWTIYLSDYVENQLDQNLYSAVSDKREWDWKDEYDFDRKFKSYLDELDRIENQLVMIHNEVRPYIVRYIFEGE